MNSDEIHRLALDHHANLINRARSEIKRHAEDKSRASSDWALDSLHIKSILHPDFTLHFRQYSLDLKAAGIFFPNPEPYGLDLWVWMSPNEESRRRLTLPVDQIELEGVARAILGAEWSDFAYIVEIPDVPVKRVVLLIDSTGAAVEIDEGFPFDRTSLRGYPIVHARPLTKIGGRTAAASSLRLPRDEEIDRERKWLVNVDFGGAAVDSIQLDILSSLVDRLRIPGEINRDFRPLRISLKEKEVTVLYLRLSDEKRHRIRFYLPEIESGHIVGSSGTGGRIPVNDPSPGQWVSFTLQEWRELFGVGYLGELLEN